MRGPFLTCGTLFLLLSQSSFADLKPGVVAPPFSVQASLGGSVSTFDLSEALKSGPVVLYFYPAAFTSGCTVEAHDFAAAIEQYRAMGAQVIGISHDSIETLSRFSVSECRGKFAVGADPDLTVARSYDAILAAKPEYANRTSYVISPDGKILYSFTDLNPEKHVANTLEALKAWKSRQAR